jgi:small subunit ribosomal protein S24e
LKIKIKEKVDNKLLNRQDIHFSVEHPGTATPPRLDVLAKLAALLNCKEDQLFIIELAGMYGQSVSRGYARLYPSKEDAHSQEYSFIIKRHQKSEETEKPAPKEAAKPAPKEAAKEKPSEES